MNISPIFAKVLFSFNRKEGKTEWDCAKAKDYKDNEYNTTI